MRLAGLVVGLALGVVNLVILGVVLFMGMQPH
jgi:hypothetical protein